MAVKSKWYTQRINCILV